MEPYLEELIEISWEDGKKVPLPQSSYRSRTVIVCSTAGRQEAEFSGGVRAKYFSYIELMANGQWVKRGANIVPRLPDGRFLMVVEQRPPHFAFEQKPPAYIEFSGHRIELDRFGPYSSLEFPGGGIDERDNTIAAGALRELWEETDIDDQEVEAFIQYRPVYPMGSDIATENYNVVMFLSGGRFSERVENDGGLRIFALTEVEVDLNRRLGVFSAGQAGLLNWAFYKELQEALRCGDIQSLIEMRYISRETMKLKRPR